ncbi:hypothetical protein [Halocatena marina]|uniref:hypothetical protein n=1 Tax=Halocatena marina TaxID=2934937 RepID=UPI00200BB747|nr:hypothetical protein [Halocatena marina]
MTAQRSDTRARRARTEGALRAVGNRRTHATVEITAKKDRYFHDALSVVKQGRPTAAPNPALHEWAVIYLAA